MSVLLPHTNAFNNSSEQSRLYLCSVARGVVSASRQPGLLCVCAVVCVCVCVCVHTCHPPGTGRSAHGHNVPIIRSYFLLLGLSRRFRLLIGLSPPGPTPSVSLISWWPHQTRIVTYGHAHTPLWTRLTWHKHTSTAGFIHIHLPK